MENTVEENLKMWDNYTWAEDGDEWKGQAEYCKQPYEMWKASLVETLLKPYLSPDKVVLEIAPGHGRWSTQIVTRCKKLILVDLSPSCIEFCKKMFGQENHVECVVNDGKKLNGVPDSSVDFVWSYDSFVHMDENVIASYLNEFSRVLRPGGKAVIHHANRNDSWLWLGFTRHWGDAGKKFYRNISMGNGNGKDHDGWRSNVSKETVHALAEKTRLQVTKQLQFWDKEGKFGVPRFNDYITILSKP